MPSYRDAFPEEDRWALSYYVLSLSAYKDPLTLRAAGDLGRGRAALNDLELASAARRTRPTFRVAARRRPAAATGSARQLSLKENETWTVSRSPDPMRARC